MVEGAKIFLTVAGKRIDADDYTAGCKNGILDLNRKIIVDSTIIVTKRLGVAFDPAATCPKLMNFLESIFPNDPEKIRFLQRAVGYTLTGWTKAQCLFLLLGQGANGKSTLLKIIRALMGEYGTSIPMSVLMASRSGNDRTDELAGLRGYRFVSAHETEVGQRLSVTKVKLLTGGDPITCQPRKGAPLSYQPSFKLWLAMNDLPEIPPGDEAIWRRVHIITFLVTISEGERNMNLFEELEPELPGILNWALAGLEEFNRVGLKSPASIVDATRAYRRDNDTVGQFIDGACMIDPEARTLMKDLHNVYARWCAVSGLIPLGNVQFGKEMTRLGFDVYSTKSGNGRKGVRLLPKGNEKD
ncbi:phage/plasmid primase, P4 family [Methylobacterium sp. CB376]|uniref:DNA primase family protein n=1 Tax=Methylobacterium sp. CB376 TaxID=3138063 RepID=UPI000152D92B|nr:MULTISPECIES: phage/plasmid primase, P4 family [Methylobacterium]WFT82927.1 phage/plasmid primase, P4 family [Methylobacterium nodulans]